MNRHRRTPRARGGILAVVVLAALGGTLLSYAAARSDGASRRPPPLASRLQGHHLLDHGHHPRQPPPLAGQLQGHHFQITVITRGGRVERPISAIDLFFDNNKSVSARASCNWLFFRWKIKHGQLVTRHWVTTAMYCGGKLLNYDLSIMRFLSARPTVVVHGATLVLRKPTLEWRGHAIGPTPMRTLAVVGLRA